MTVLATMGCTTSAVDHPAIAQRQVQLQPIIKQSNGHVTHSTNDLLTINHSKPNSSRLRTSRVAPAAASCELDGRVSPAFSDRTDASKSIKRVAFTDDPELPIGSQATVTKIDLNNGGTVNISGSPTELRKARRKREKNLRKRLLNKMGEAESLSERLLLESERLSLTSSMSRATSRTGSSYPGRLDLDRGDDCMTEISAFEGNTPRLEADT